MSSGVMAEQHSPAHRSPGAHHPAYFGRRGLSPWWRSVRDGAGALGRGPILTEFAGAGDLEYMSDYRSRLRRGGEAGRVAGELGEDVLADVVGRCRYLRNLPWKAAVRRADAMYGVMHDLVCREGFTAVIGQTIDYFVADLAERAIVRAGGQYIGLIDAVVPDRSMFFASRGEHRALRSVDDVEVEAAAAHVSAPAFAPFLPPRFASGVRDFARLWASAKVRDSALTVLRHLPQYREVPQFAITGRLVPEYRIRLRDFAATNARHSDWEQRIGAVPEERRLFLALQMNPEASTDYWVRHDRRMIDYEQVTLQAIEALSGAGWVVAVKDHPNMFGWRKIDFIRRIMAVRNVVMVPSRVPSQHVIAQCAATFTFQGTVGLQSMLAGRKSVVVGEPYYSVPGCFVHLMTPADVAHVADLLDAFVPTVPLPERQRRVLRHCLSATVPGWPLGHLTFAGSDADVAAARQTGASLAEWLPILCTPKANGD